MNLNDNFHILLYSNYSNLCKPLVHEIKSNNIDIQLFCVDHPTFRERLKKSMIKTVPTLISMENNQLSIISDSTHLGQLIKAHIPPRYDSEVQKKTMLTPDNMSIPPMEFNPPATTSVRQPMQSSTPVSIGPPDIQIPQNAIIDKSNVMAKAMEMAKMHENKIKQKDPHTKL